MVSASFGAHGSIHKTAPNSTIIHRETLFAAKEKSPAIGRAFKV